MPRTRPSLTRSWPSGAPARYAIEVNKGWFAEHDVAVGDMVEALRRDYGAMSAMIFGPIPAIQAVLQSVAALEARLNAG